MHCEIAIMRSLSDRRKMRVPTQRKTGETVLDRKSVERLWKDHVQLDKCIASLDEDGLIEILPGGGVRLPV